MNCHVYNLYRIKFEQPSSESETSGSEADDEKPVLEFYDDDPELPMLARMDHGYPVHSLIQILLTSDVQENRICRVQPLGVTKNAVFQVDLDSVPFEDLKADDLGSWMATGTRRTYFRFTCTKAIRYATGVPASSEYLLLTRRYYVHKTYNRFHRIISDIKGKLCPVLLVTCTGRYTCSIGGLFVFVYTPEFLFYPHVS